jgi:tRNA nucleotidyltransferase (CCA-adding enzyme)
MRLFSTLPGELISLFRSLGNSADAINAKAYLIGAYPRSIVLKEDCSDLEICITGSLEKTIETFFNSCKIVKDKTIKTEGRYTFIANPYSEGDFIRLASARRNSTGGAGDIKSEVFCRGFSIEAIAVSLNSIDFGNIVDYAGALTDTKNSVLRSLRRELFSEEPTYILKALQYKVRYGLSFDPITETLWKKAVKGKALQALSKEEISSELKKIKKEKNGENELKVLKEFMGV